MKLPNATQTELRRADTARAVVLQIMGELGKAQRVCPPMASAADGFAVILEELEELKAHVFTNPNRRNNDAMRAEAVQIAAMALRFIIDVCDEPGKLDDIWSFFEAVARQDLNRRPTWDEMRLVAKNFKERPELFTLAARDYAHGNAE